MNTLLIYDKRDEVSRATVNFLQNEIFNITPEEAKELGINIGFEVMHVSKFRIIDKELNEIFTPYNTYHDLIILIGDLRISSTCKEKIENSKLNVIDLMPYKYDFPLLNVRNRLVYPMVRLRSILFDYFSLYILKSKTQVENNNPVLAIRKAFSLDERNFIEANINKVVHIDREILGQTDFLHVTNEWTYDAQTITRVKNSFINLLELNKPVPEYCMTTTASIYGHPAKVYIGNEGDMSHISVLLDNFINQEFYYEFFVFINIENDNETEGPSTVTIYPNYLYFDNTAAELSQDDKIEEKRLDILEIINKICSITGNDSVIPKMKDRINYALINNLNPAIDISGSWTSSFKKAFANAFIGRLVGRDVKIIE